MFLGLLHGNMASLGIEYDTKRWHLDMVDGYIISVLGSGFCVGVCHINDMTDTFSISV